MPVRILDLGQVTNVGQNVQMVKHIEVPVLLLYVPDLINITFFIIHVAKADGICRTSLHTGSF
jgi:hypothetical protein